MKADYRLGNLTTSAIVLPEIFTVAVKLGINMGALRKLNISTDMYHHRGDHRFEAGQLLAFTAIAVSIGIDIMVIITLYGRGKTLWHLENMPWIMRSGSTMTG